MAREMDRLETLQLTRKGWCELSKSGSAMEPLMFQGFQNKCPCCSYDEQHKDNCKNCAVRDWGGLAGYVDLQSHCSNIGTPYNLWNRAESARKRKAAAVAMVKLLDREIRTLLLEEGCRT